jgi:hypothetical protein
LNSVVGEMYVEIPHFLLTEVELIRGSTQVTLLKEVHLHLVSEQHPHTDVKFPATEKQGFLHIFLNHKRVRADCEETSIAHLTDPE